MNRERKQIRLTPQRRAVWEALYDSHDHPTAADLYERARKAYVGISFATVYNSLRYLKNQGMAVELAVGGGPSRFDANTDPHGHIRCVDCGAVADVDEPDTSVVAIPDGWVTATVAVTVEGYCPDCSVSA